MPGDFVRFRVRQQTSLLMFVSLGMYILRVLCRVSCHQLYVCYYLLLPDSPDQAPFLGLLGLYSWGHMPVV